MIFAISRIGIRVLLFNKKFDFDVSLLLWHLESFRLNFHPETTLAAVSFLMRRQCLCLGEDILLPDSPQFITQSTIPSLETAQCGILKAYLRELINKRMKK